MKEYAIEIEEILQRICIVEANSLEEAISIIEKRYDNEEIELTYIEDYKETNFREYEDKGEL